MLEGLPDSRLVPEYRAVAGVHRRILRVQIHNVGPHPLVDIVAACVHQVADSVFIVQLLNSCLQLRDGSIVRRWLSQRRRHRYARPFRGEVIRHDGDSPLVDVASAILVVTLIHCVVVQQRDAPPFVCQSVLVLVHAALDPGPAFPIALEPDAVPAPPGTFAVCAQAYHWRLHYHRAERARRYAIHVAGVFAQPRSDRGRDVRGGIGPPQRAVAAEELRDALPLAKLSEMRDLSLHVLDVSDGLDTGHVASKRVQVGGASDKASAKGEKKIEGGRPSHVVHQL